ncbi:hypothetical protein N9077_02440, partial [bacterium]|nr:hypothetical protein [bacterium]
EFAPPNHPLDRTAKVIHMDPAHLLPSVSHLSAQTKGCKFPKILESRAGFETPGCSTAQADLSR